MTPVGDLKAVTISAGNRAHPAMRFALLTVYAPGTPRSPSVPNRVTIRDTKFRISSGCAGAAFYEEAGKAFNNVTSAIESAIYDLAPEAHCEG